MNQAEYIQLCQNTKSDLFIVPKTPNEVDIAHAVIGISTEVSEIMRARQDRFVDFVNLDEEFGDICWYLGIYAFARGKTNLGDGPEPKATWFFDDLIRMMGVISGTALDILKKSLFYNRSLDYSVLDECMGQTFFAVQRYCMHRGFNAERLMATNIAKLATRYPDKFTEHHAINRDLTRERKVLTGPSYGGNDIVNEALRRE